MARVNVTIPDETIDAARALGLNVSSIAAEALAEELRRREKVERLRAELDALDAELGTVPEDVSQDAAQWVADLVSPTRRHGVA